MDQGRPRPHASTKRASAGRRESAIEELVESVLKYSATTGLPALFGTAGGLQRDRAVVTGQSPDDIDKGVADRLLHLMGNIRVSAFLIDGDRRVLFATGLAQELLSSGAFIARGERLCVPDRAADQRLQTLLSHAVSRGTDKATPVETWLAAVPRSGNRPLIARIIPTAALEEGPLGRTRAIVLVLDPNERTPPSAQLLQRLFQFTPAEALVARLLVAGQSVEQVAEQNRVTTGTVRLQLRSIFAKTGTGRQGELIALLSRLSIICGAAVEMPAPDGG